MFNLLSQWERNASKSCWNYIKKINTYLTHTHAKIKRKKYKNSPPSKWSNSKLLTKQLSVSRDSPSYTTGWFGLETRWLSSKGGGVGDVAARGWFSNPMGQRIPRLQLSIEHSRVCIVARQSSRSDTSYCIVQAIPLSIQSTRNLLFSLSRDCRFAQDRTIENLLKEHWNFVVVK